MCKNSIWDLINSNINKRDERDVQTGCTGNVHIAAIRMMRLYDEIVNVYEKEFVLRSLLSSKWDNCSALIINYVIAC